MSFLAFPSGASVLPGLSFCSSDAALVDLVPSASITFFSSLVLVPFLAALASALAFFSASFYALAASFSALAASLAAFSAFFSSSDFFGLGPI